MRTSESLKELLPAFIAARQAFGPVRRENTAQIGQSRSYAYADLATVVEATLRLVPTPRCAGLLVSHFDDLLKALEAVQRLTAHGPAAIELLDRILLNLTRDNADLVRAASRLIEANARPTAP